MQNIYWKLKTGGRLCTKPSNTTIEAKNMTATSFSLVGVDIITKPL
jgi:hypothetical protein